MNDNEPTYRKNFIMPIIDASDELFSKSAHADQLIDYICNNIPDGPIREAIFDLLATFKLLFLEGGIILRNQMQINHITTFLAAKNISIKEGSLNGIIHFSNEFTPTLLEEFLLSKKVEFHIEDFLSLGAGHVGYKGSGSGGLAVFLPLEYYISNLRLLPLKPSHSFWSYFNQQNLKPVTKLDHETSEVFVVVNRLVSRIIEARLDELSVEIQVKYTIPKLKNSQVLVANIKGVLAPALYYFVLNSLKNPVISEA